MKTKYLAEVGVRYVPTNSIIPNGVATTSISVANYMRDNMYDKELLEYQERFVVLMLNRRNAIIGYHTLSVGGQTGTVADVRILFAVALKCGATSIIISHNHPSGNTKPSDTDIRLTNNISRIGDIMEIKVLDHIIITKESHYSFADEGKI